MVAISSMQRLQSNEMTLPQVYPQNFMNWASAVTNAAASATSQSGLLLGHVIQTDMPNVELVHSNNLFPIPDLELEFIVPDSGFVLVTIQAMISRTLGTGSVHVGVSLDYSGPSVRSYRQFISADPITYDFNLFIELDPGSSVNLVAGARMDTSNNQGLLYRSSGASCLYMARAL